MLPTRFGPPSTSRLLRRALAVSTVLLVAGCSDNGSGATTLQSIGVTPTNPSLAAGSMLQLHATATYSDHSTKDFTTTVGWTSSDSAVATVSSAGVVTAVTPGTATVTATSLGVTGSTSVTVTTATLQAIAVTPPNPSTAKGSTVQFTATGTYSDSTTQDLTSQVTWASDTATVATISSAGLATAVDVGSTSISATSSGVTGSTLLTVSTATLQSIAVTPPNPSVGKGSKVQFTATGTFSDNSTQDLTTQVTWASATATVATISNAAGSNGLATTLVIGTSDISATLSGVTGSTVLTVTTATLQSIAVTPPNPSVAKGRTLQFTATGTFSDNSTQDVTNQVTWASATTTVATISNAAGSKGLASAVSVGTSNISAALSGVSGSTVLTVTTAALQSIAVTPPNPSTAKGSTLQFTATGTFSDNSIQDLTNQVAWASATTTVATISNAAGSKGLASAVNVGTSNISAALSGVSGSTVLTVTAATLQSIAVTPPNPSVAKGSPVQFTATGTFTDNSIQDITNQVTWASATTTVATISNAAGSQGLASTVGVGTSNISAALSGKTGNSTLTVTAATLQSIAVTPPNPSTAKGSALQFIATGTFTDNSTQDLTNQVTWASATATVATISNAAGSKGLASAVNVGTSNISAALSGVSGSTVLTVTAATLQSIAVTPPNPSVAKGSPVQFTATGTFSDNSIQDITNQVTWASDTTTVATISNAAGSQGLASTVGVGTSNISAALSGKTGNSTLTVTAATLESISVTPATPSRPVPITVAFSATGIFTDGTTQDLTNQVTWSSSNTAVATISNAGVATPVAAGNTTITAAMGALSGSTVLTVTSVTLNSITVTPANPSIAKGTTEQFTATGNFSDGSSLDLTQTVTWASTTTSVATISNAAGTKGEATAAGVGTTTISAAFGGQTGSTLLTVTPATLVSIAVTPAAPSIARGLTQQFVATGTFSDGSTQVLTNAVTWSSSDLVVASIANAGSPGLATGLSVGTTTISATQGTISGSATLQVTDAILVSIEVTPDNVSIPQTTTQQFTAMGTFSDTAVVDITTQVTWTSSDNTVIDISNAAGSRGLATALSKGNNIDITATRLTVSGTAKARVP